MTPSTIKTKTRTINMSRIEEELSIAKRTRDTLRKNMTPPTTLANYSTRVEVYEALLRGDYDIKSGDSCAATDSR